MLRSAAKGGPYGAARMLEGIMQLAADNDTTSRRAIVPGPHNAAMRAARTCYDHIAGRLGVAIADRLLADGAIVFDGESGQFTGRCGTALKRLGIASVAQARGESKRALCRPRMDWSERRAHVAGQLGALICAHGFEQGWLRRRGQSRALEITPQGAVALRAWLGAKRWRQVMA